MGSTTETATRLDGSDHPVRRIHDLHATHPLLESSADLATVPFYPDHAATAILGAHEDTARVPGRAGPNGAGKTTVFRRITLGGHAHAFEGTMLFVSHDRTFLRGLANRVLEIGGEDGTGRPVTYDGTYEEYVARSGHEAPGVHA